MSQTTQKVTKIESLCLKPSPDQSGFCISDREHETECVLFMTKEEIDEIFLR